MEKEEKLFQVISDKIKKEFDEIGDKKVKEAVTAAFGAYENAYKEHTESEVKEIKASLGTINKQLEDLDESQSKEVAKQLSSIEKQLATFEEVLKAQGEAISKSKMKQGGKGSGTAFADGIKTYLSAKLPTEEGKVLFDAMEGMNFEHIGNIDGENAKGKVAKLSVKSMFAAIDHTNENSTAGQAIARDMNTMGFRNIPPILNDHVADIFTTPRMEKKANMTLRIFHTYVDGADIKTEGTGSFAKSSVQLKSQDFKVFTYGTMYRISVEEFEDVPEITQELNSVIPDRLMNDLDIKILTDGGDNSTTPWGAFSTNPTSPNVTLFNPYLYAGSNPDADVADLVGKMKLQARSQNYRVNAVLAHDNFYDNYEGLRDENRNSLMDRRVQFSSTGEITGMSGLSTRRTRVMNETAVWVGATPSQILGIRENVMMQVGLNTDDFETHNISTKFWGRYAYGAKDELANIYTADFIADIAILQMDAATALDYTNQVALGTGGFDKLNITISLLSTAGCTALIDENLVAYQDAIEAEAGIASLAALQAVIDTVNAA